jgi:hypothetical protein
VFHLSFVVAFLFAAWLFSISPAMIGKWAAGAAGSLSGRTILGLSAVAGLSILGAVRLYIRLWGKLYRWVFARLASRDLARFLQG